MPDKEKVIKGLECCMKWTGEPNTATCHCSDCSYTNMDILGQRCLIDLINDTLALLKEQDARIKKYEYLFDFLGIGFREWATKILDGEAEAICETDEHEHKTVITFKLI